MIPSPSLPFRTTTPEATDQGVGGSGRRELKSVPFISYLSALQRSQLLSDDMVNGVEIHCEEKGSCPPGCHLCHHQATTGGVSGRGRTGNSRNGEQPSPVPVLLEVSRVVPLYSLVQDNVTKEVRNQHGGFGETVCICVYLPILHVHEDVFAEGEGEAGRGTVKPEREWRTSEVPTYLLDLEKKIK